MPPLVTTGLAPLPTVGVLFYNGVQFNCLHTSTVSMAAVPDEARRTTKWVEYTITVDATVTLEPGDQTTDITMTGLRTLLEAQCGTLGYQGKGLGNVAVNFFGGGYTDVNFGPKPKLLDFQPLGGSRGARIRWTVTTYLPPVIPATTSLRTQAAGPSLGPVLQFNEETSVSYDDEDYSALAIKGTLEIPMTRATVSTRTITQTVDDYRQLFLGQVAQSVDLTRFKVTHREFNVSRDKRTMEWSFRAEELPPMGLPIGATRARGSMHVQPLKQGPALYPFVVTLQATYTIRKDFPRRSAYWAFVSLLHFRMTQSARGQQPDTKAKAPEVVEKPTVAAAAAGAIFGPLGGGVTRWWSRIFGPNMETIPGSPARAGTRGQALLLDFRFTEGLYEDSKTMTFSATWRLFCSLQTLLVGCGVWKWDPNTLGGNIWKMSIQDISGWRSWLQNRLDPTQDLIVDMGEPV